jgi:hypothetical protein
VVLRDFEGGIEWKEQLKGKKLNKVGERSQAWG